MKNRREVLKRLTVKVFEPLNVSPYTVNNVISRVYDVREENQRYGLTSYQAARREAIVGLLSVIGGGAYLMFDFLYGGPIKNALYPQNTERGKTMTSLTSQIVESTSSLFSSSSAIYTLEGRVFFDKGTSKFGTAGNGAQDDTDSEPGEQNAKILFLDENSKLVGTATTDSSGDFGIDLPKGNFTAYPVISNKSKDYGYMCQSLDEFRTISDGYDVVVGENNPKAYLGLMQGWLGYPQWSVHGDYGGYYDRDQRKWYILWWNGEGGHVDSVVSDKGEDNNAGTHFEAELGEVIPAFAPGTVEAVRPDLPENWVGISHQLSNGEYYETWYAHNNEVLVQKGQKISRYQPIAKAGRKGVGIDINDAVVHFGMIDVWNDNSGKKWVRELDPYKAVFPISQKNSGVWATPLHGNEYSWISLPEENNPNWKNRWIIENQTHF